MFITFEGGEGSGKSTQARVVAKKLADRGLSVVLVHEPGDTLLGNRMRRWLKWGGEVSPEVELFLFAAARAQLVTEVIRPALERGSVVICDRFSDSTVAYQGYGRGLDLGLIEAINSAATGGLSPDLVVLADMAVTHGLHRKRSKRDRFEREELAFHQRVREGYLKLAAADPQRWLVVDATLPRPQVQKLIWARVEALLGRQ